MSERYSFYADSDEDNELVPIADGSYYTGDMDAGYSDGQCFLQFFDADGVTPFTPTDGTIQFYSAALDGQYLADSASITIDAVDVAGTGNATYTVPTFPALAIKSKMVLSGIVGPTYVKAIHVRY